MKALYLLLVACALHVTAFAQNYYVNKATGSDTNSGAITAPFATIQHAADLATAGDTVFVVPGSYKERIICATNSGTQSAPIVFAHYYGNWGSSLEVTGDSDTIGNSGTALWTLQGVDHIIIRDFYFRNQVGHNVNGIWIKGGCSNITISGCTFDNISFFLRMTDTPMVAETHRAIPILVQGTSSSKPVSNLILKNNWMDDCQVGGGSGIMLEGNIDTFLITGTGMTGVGGSCMYAAGYKGVCPNPAKDQPRHGTIKYNMVYGQSSPVEIKGTVYLDGCRDILVERNRILQGYNGLNIDCNAHGKTSKNFIVRSNYLVTARYAGLSIGKSDTTFGFGKVTNCTVYGNSFYGNGRADGSAGEMNIEYVEGIKLHSNIFYTEPDKHTVFKFNAGSGADFHHNLYYHPSTPAVPKSYSWLGISYATLADYQAATGQDAGSHFADPLFEADWGDMHLKANSPAINSGCPDFVPEPGEQDIDSLPRVVSIIDCGAHETDIVTSVTEVSTQSSYTLSPNPATTYLKLTSKARTTDDMIVLEIIDASGKLHWVGKADTRTAVTDIDISNLTSGVYMLSIWTGLSYEGLKFVKP